MQGVGLDKLAAQVAPAPLAIVLGSELGVNWLVYIALAAIGLWLATLTGLGAPLLDNWTRGLSVAGRLRAMLPAPIGVGILVGVLGIVIPLAAQSLLAPAAQNSPAPNPPAWQGLLASFSAGVTEEVLLRLFVMTLLAWLGGLLSRRPNGQPTMAVIWVANVLAALLFGAAHLPAQAAITPLTPMVVAAVIGLNALGGVFFGWMYASRGLESAMISHASADIVVHVLVPLVTNL
jgi:membrane protease YdiL (CAAX protease family)